MSNTRPCLQISLSALKQNYAVLSALTPESETAAVVKADAYGLGVTEVASALVEAGCRTFFVAYSFEGVALRKLLSDITPEARICVFNGPSREDIREYIHHNLIPVLNTTQQIDLWQDAGSGPAMLHIDTGMNRLGLSLKDALALTEHPPKNLQLTHILSHFACSDDPDAQKNAEQIEAFSRVISTLSKVFPQAELSISASGGLFLPDRVQEKLIRPGLALYGIHPQGNEDSDLHCVATLQAPVLQFRDIRAGETVGYGATYKATSSRKLATLAIGYGDGYPRSLSNAGKVWLGGMACPVVGIISMDLITVDVTDCPQSVSVGDMAECFGANLPISEIAQLAGTIPYELLVTLGARIKRNYVA